MYPLYIYSNKQNPFSLKDPRMQMCQKENQESSRSVQRGEHVAKCKPTGQYEEIQCEPSTRQCWCVDPNGNEIQGTRTNGAISCPRIGKLSGTSS